MREYIREIVLESPGRKRLRIFDFDDTLVKTDAKVHVTESSGRTFDLTPGEYAAYVKKRGDKFDYGDFERLINPRAIRWTGRVLRNVYEKHGPEGVVVVSARGHGEPIQQFLTEAGFRGIEVVALGNPDPRAKAAWVDVRITQDGLELVEFFDDSRRNVVAVERLRRKHPTVKIVTRNVMNRYGG